jgi:integrase/recombinase XerD
LEFAQCQRRGPGARSTQAHRYGAVRRFMEYQRLHQDPETEVIPAGLLQAKSQRARPYFATADEIRCLLSAARHYPSTSALLPASYYCLLGLLVVTGMRVGEALNLEDRDIDWTNRVLTIRQAKFGKDRLVPLHASCLRQIQAYRNCRDLTLGKLRGRSPRLFLTRKGTSLNYCRVNHVFRKLRRIAGWPSTGRCAPRLHDLRHRFAVETLRRWYAMGEPVEQRLPVLATYLGHSTREGTYGYLSGTPALRTAAAARLDRRWKGGHNDNAR